MDEHSLLRAAHERRANKDHVTLWNHGWVATDTVWLSKTERGILETRRVAPGKYTHKYRQSISDVIQEQAEKIELLTTALAAERSERQASEAGEM